MNITMKKALNYIYQHYGKDNQLEKLKEECQELIEAIEDYQIDPNCETWEHVLSEVADVKVVNGQFHLHSEWIVDREMSEKVIRQLTRIGNED